MSIQSVTCLQEMWSLFPIFFFFFLGGGGGWGVAAYNQMRLEV